MANQFKNNLTIEGRKNNIKKVRKMYKSSQLFNPQMIPHSDNLPPQQLIDWMYENWGCKNPFMEV